MNNKTAPKIKRALISVSDKTGVVELASMLSGAGVDILSTGGTASTLRDAGLTIIDVSDVTDFPEMMAGRVKTLHPKIHGGVLARRGIDDADLAKHEITPIDLVVVNLYPFQEVIANPDCHLTTAIENIDIGGPTLIRAAAKNHQAVTVLVEPADYAAFIELFNQHQAVIPNDVRYHYATKAFAHTANYDLAISQYLAPSQTHYPETLTLPFQKVSDLRYGENPHQTAALYQEAHATSSIVAAELLQGKPLSFNNINDADAAWLCVKSFTEQPACAIVKHANPCGVAIQETALSAYQRAFKTDPTSSFGGIIAFNRELDPETAQAIIDNQFVELIVAPQVSSTALEILQAKPNVRVLQCGDTQSNEIGWDMKRIEQGLLLQQTDTLLAPDELEVVSQRQPTDRELLDCLFAWRVAKYVKSNAIVYAKEQATLGIGAGQMSRIDSARIASWKAEAAGFNLAQAAMASDAFFPFRDSIDTAARAGITAIIQPGGSIRDEEVIQAANEANIAMIFTGIRHFRH